MGKISQVSSKYIVNASIEIEGIVDRPDVIGAIFGQTEGLLGSELELRELQRNGRIGRIEVNVEVRNGKSQGSIIIPSSLDKAETAVIAAALEIIQRIGPCNAKIQVKNIEDVRISKRQFVVERAKQLLKKMMEEVLPDSQELADEVAYSVRVMEVQEYGKDRLPAGPAIDESPEIILVEGRADVLNLLKHGFKNVIAMNGTSVPQTVIDLSKEKEVLAFVDGDRGGNLILKELFAVAEIDFVTKAPSGKEVEELTQKEIHKALRSKIAAEQAQLELSQVDTSHAIRRPMIAPMAPPRPVMQQRPATPLSAPALQAGPPSAPQLARPTRTITPMPQPRAPGVKGILDTEEKKKIKSLLEDLVGTRGAVLLDQKLNVLGKVPISELEATLKSLTGGVYAVVFDGIIDKPLVEIAERSNLRYLVAMDSKVNPRETRVGILNDAALSQA
ncbi:DNA primase [Candidatus Woesearchaeota archaeon]|nr:DNA primase [Candidatus Woesearchaeota archaeon]